MSTEDKDIKTYRVVFEIDDKVLELSLETHNIMSIEPDDDENHEFLDTPYVLTVVPRSQVQ